MTTIIIILLSIIGAALGSFINVLIYRLPRKESIIFPASHCGNCKKHIPFYLNVPILSYIVLGGKCKYCGAKFHWHHLLVEVISPLILIACFLQYGAVGVLFFKYSLLMLFLIPIFFIDALHQIIPHWLSIPLIPIGLLIALVPGNDVGIIDAIFTASFIFIVLLLLAYSYRTIRKADGLGGGDIWLLTGIATFFGVRSMPYIVIVAAVLGILYFIAIVRDKDKGFAFGTFIVLATMLWTLSGADVLIDKIL